MKRCLVLVVAIAMGCSPGMTGPARSPNHPGGPDPSPVKLETWNGQLPQNAASSAVMLAETPTGWVAFGVDTVAGKVAWEYALAPDQAGKFMAALFDGGNKFPPGTQPPISGPCHTLCGGDWNHVRWGVVDLMRRIAELGAHP